MKRVLIESPYAGAVERNIRYARQCVRDSLLRGESPIASHLLYTQPFILDDLIDEERQLGIEAGLVWLPVVEMSCVYWDFGISKGMEYGIERAKQLDIPIDFRKIL